MTRPKTWKDVASCDGYCLDVCNISGPWLKARKQIKTIYLTEKKSCFNFFPEREREIACNIRQKR